MLAEVRSEIMKQECKVVSHNTCTRELQRQAHSQRLELDEANCGNEESRREQDRSEEELALREKALRNTRIKNIHEMDELRRVQEMRVDEFSKQKLTESHATTQELTSQIQDLQERVNCMNDSKEFQDKESICSGKLSQSTVPSPRSMLSRDRSKPPDTWNLSGTQGNVFWQSTSHARSITDVLSRNSFFTQRIKVLKAETQCKEVQGDLSLEVKNELEAQFQCLCLQGSRQS